MKLLGKLPKVADPRNLQLVRYLDSARLPPLGLSRAWSSRIDRWGMWLNDQLKCCAYSAQAHAVQTWCANSDQACNLTDADVRLAYQHTGYDPARPETDQGDTMLHALQVWRDHGLGGKYKILAWAEINPHDHHSMSYALDLFGGVYAGFQLPTSCQTEDVWSAHPGSYVVWGGHAIWLSDRGPFTRQGPSWAARRRMTLEFVDRYCDEAYAPLSETWLGPDLVAPNGLRLDELYADLARVRRLPH